MIKGIILDVDGVIVGEKIGFNSPYPNSKVIEALRNIRSRGIAISLCTAKPHFAIKEIIESCNLDNYHISDGGSVLINPVNNKILSKHIISSNVVKEVLTDYLENNVYTEIYTTDNYYIQKNFDEKITKGHAHVLQRNPVIVESLVDEAHNLEITKIMPIAKDVEDKKNLERIFEKYSDKLMLSWGVHPVVLPLQFGIITEKGISKKQGAEDIIQSFGCKHEEVLGVGDSTSDWQFIGMCGYAGAMGNASSELKDLVSTKNEKGYVGKNVDENGILYILKYFKLID